MLIKYLTRTCLLWVLMIFPSPLDRCQAWQSESTAKDLADQPQEPSLLGANRHKTTFLRLQTDEFDHPIALQTATAKYVLKNEKGQVLLEVSLESVIHIADASYFRSFQKRFERYDAVLFESLIMPADSASTESELPSGFQLLRQLSSGTLGLAYNFEEVDYTPENMRNADLSVEEISKRMESLGEEKTTLMADLLAYLAQKMSAGAKQSTTDQGKSSDSVADESLQSTSDKFDFSILTDADGIMKIRRILASLLVDSKLLESALPPGVHEVIIGDRNDRAMSVLENELKSGRRRIAIFFGVGHMADFQRRLVEDHGMELASVNWRNAWDLRDGAIEGAPLEGLIESTFRDSFKNKLREMAKGLRKSGDAETTGKAAVTESDDANSDEKIKALQDAIDALEAKIKAMEEAPPGKKSPPKKDK